MKQASEIGKINERNKDAMEEERDIRKEKRGSKEKTKVKRITRGRKERKKERLTHRSNLISSRAVSV